jgi:hypothetical protein
MLDMIKLLGCVAVAWLSLPRLAHAPSTSPQRRLLGITCSLRYRTTIAFTHMQAGTMLMNVGSTKDNTLFVQSRQQRQHHAGSAATGLRCITAFTRWFVFIVNKTLKRSRRKRTTK